MWRKRLDLTLGFLKSLDRAASTEDVCATLLGFLAGYGIENSFMGTIPAPGTRTIQRLDYRLLTAVPAEWGQRYLKRSYVFADPTVRLLNAARQPFLWADAQHRFAEDAQAVRVMDEAGDFGMRYGITIPLLTLDRELAAASFSGRHLEASLEDFDLLQLVATYTFAHLLVLRDRQATAAVEHLSAREREVLQWAAEGKTAADIADVLNISAKGVEFHLQEVRRKLGTLNSTQAVAVGLRRGLIS